MSDVADLIARLRGFCPNPYSGQEAAEAERDALRDALPRWRPISEFPSAPMMVVYWRGNVAEAMGWTASICGENGRDERYDLGFWDGVEWCHIGTGHALFEFEEQYSNPAAPTHWAPLLPAALAKTETAQPRSRIVAVPNTSPLQCRAWKAYSPERPELGARYAATEHDAMVAMEAALAKTEGKT